MSEKLFVDKLAEVIRKADGNHDMSAGELSDAIADSGILYQLEHEAREEGYTRGYEVGRAFPTELEYRVRDLYARDTTRWFSVALEHIYAFIGGEGYEIEVRRVTPWEPLEQMP